MLTVLHPIFIHHHSRLRAVVCPDQAAFRVALEKNGRSTDQHDTPSMILPKAIAPVPVISRKPADRDRRKGW